MTEETDQFPAAIDNLYNSAAFHQLSSKTDTSFNDIQPRSHSHFSHDRASHIMKAARDKSSRSRVRYKRSSCVIPDALLLYSATLIARV